MTAYGDDTYGAGTYGGVAVRATPTWAVQVWTAADGWVDVTCDVRRVRVQSGRSSYVDAFAASSAEVDLANFTGRYSTLTAASIWKQPGGFVTGVPIRCGPVYAGAVRWRFTGTTDAVFDSWPGMVDALASVAASDGFKLLARHNGGARAAVGAGELTGARVNRLADDGGWTAPRRVDAGSVALQATTLDGVTLDLLRQVGESEWGWLYVAGDGALVFLQRNAGDTRPNMTAVQFTFTDSDALVGACYGEAVVGSDESHIINTATITPPGHAASGYTAAASAGWFGPRTYNRTDLPINTDADAATLAQLVVTYYAADDRRVDAVTFDGVHRPNNWPAAAAVDITDRVRFVRTFPGADQLDAELLVLGRTDEWTAAGANGDLAAWSITLTTGTALTITALGAWDVGTWDQSVWGV